MKKLLLALCILPVIICCSGGDDEVDRQTPDDEVSVETPEELDPRKAFPQNVEFKNCIKPNHVTQDVLNSDVKSYYTYWRNKYVKPSNGGTQGGGYYVEMRGTGGDGSEITTSEAHGYGMIIFALMAGADQQAKKYYDGMYNMFDKHRSTGNAYCMSWVIHNTESSDHDQGSASDGDLDVAYSLLLADQQWSSEGQLKYLDDAREMIEKGLKKSIVHPVSKRVMLGDWDSNQYSTRSSDWMAGHFRAFQQVTQDDYWNATAETVYSLIESLTKSYTSENGLMPDFIVGQSPQPAPENYLDEFKETDEYNWNACRYPWRITTDYAHFNTAKAKAAMLKLNTFIREQTNGNPAQIKAGYYLSGKPMVAYSDGAFTAPLVASCIVDDGAQVYLNKGWDILKESKGGYYDDTLCLLNMLLISGNWWNPVEP